MIFTGFTVKETCKTRKNNDNISFDSSFNYLLLFAERNRRWDLPFTTKKISSYLYRPETLFDFRMASLNSGITLIWKFFFITIIFSLSFILVEIQASNFSLSFEWTKIYENDALLKFRSQSLSAFSAFDI